MQTEITRAEMTRRLAASGLTAQQQADILAGRFALYDDGTEYVVAEGEAETEAPEAPEAGAEPPWRTRFRAQMEAALSPKPAAATPKPGKSLLELCAADLPPSREERSR